jgi:hypothetical protein
MAHRHGVKKAPVTNPSPDATNPNSGYNSKNTKDLLPTIKKGRSYSATPPKVSA